MNASCPEISAWNAGCSSVVAAEDCELGKGEQRFVATADQALFTLTAFSYSPGTNNLQVHRNGLLVDPVNIVELSNTTFFIQGETVLAGDVVVASACPGITSVVSVATSDFSTTEVVLIAGQQVISFGATVPIANSALYISGAGVDNGRLILGTDYSMDTVNNVVTLTDSYPAGTILLLSYSDSGAVAARFVSVLYDYLTDPTEGIAGPKILDSTFPDNSTIVRAYYEVLTAFTSGGAATIAFGIDVDDPAGLLVAVAYDDPALSVGYHDFIPDGTAANFTTKSTAIRDLIMVIGGSGILLGKVRVWYEFIISE